MTNETDAIGDDAILREYEHLLEVGELALVVPPHSVTDSLNVILTLLEFYDAHGMRLLELAHRQRHRRVVVDFRKLLTRSRNRDMVVPENADDDHGALIRELFRDGTVSALLKFTDQHGRRLLELAK
jgi:hypothetical protein